MFSYTSRRWENPVWEATEGVVDGFITISSGHGKGNIIFIYGIL